MTDQPTVPLKEYIERLIAESDKRIQIQFLASQEAIKKADEATEKRLTGLNELRGTLSDAQKTFITRTEAVALAALISGGIGTLIGIANFFFARMK